MAGLEAVLAAVAFQMDQVLRPVIGPLTKGFLNFADSIFNLKGTAGDVVGVIGAVVAAITAVGSALLAASALGFSLSGAFGAISGAVSTVVGAVGTVIGILGGPLTLAILAVVALVAGLWKAWDENWFNIRGIVNSAIDAIVQAVGGFISSLGSAWEVFTSVLGTVWDGFWQFAINAAKRGANTIIGVVEDLVNRMVRTLPDFITEKLGIGEVSFGRFETRSTREIVGDVTGRGGGRGRGQSDQVDRLVAAMQNQDVTTVLELDSQTVARATEPFLGSGTANQGRVFRGR
jgi:phage-related protein